MDRATETKGDLRRRLRARRREIAASREFAADAAAIATALTTALETAPKAVARPGGSLVPRSTALSYESLPHEPPTAALNQALREAGYRVLVPITLTDMRLQWCDLADPGRPELGIDAPSGADLALVPALAIDTDGTRLGQGGGCYDRVLPMLPAGTPRIALLHPGEHTGDPLPSDAHDVPVQSVLSALGLTDAAVVLRG